MAKKNHKYNLYFLSPRQVKRDRPLFIYVPGLDGTGELFQSQSDKLADYFDLRCLSIPASNSGDWNDLAQETIKLIEEEVAFNPDRPVYVCGESFGGCLALQVALIKPSLIQRLILVNPASSFNQSPLLGWGIGLTRWLPDWLHNYSAVTLLPFLAQLDRVAEGDRRALVRGMKFLPPPVVSWRLSLLRDFRVDPQELRRLDIPSLIIAGQSDRLLPSVEEARRLAALMPQARTFILPKSGHACLIETETNLYQILTEHNFIEHKNSLSSKLTAKN